jgi:hypothetical protein
MTDPAPLLTPDDLREIQILDNPDRFSDELLSELVAEFEGIVERYRGIALVSRTDIVKVRGHRSGSRTGATYATSGRCDLIVPYVEVTEVSDVSIDGGDELDTDGITVWPNGILERTAGWSGTQVTLSVTHGYTDATRPAGSKRACREFVRAKAKESAGEGPRNVSGYTDSESGYSYRVLTAAWDQGRPTGLSSFDDFVNSLPDLRIPGIG